MRILSRNKLRQTLFVCFATVFWIAVADAGIRLTLRKRLLHLPLDEKNLTYRYDSLLGWFPIASQRTFYRDSRFVTIRNNTRGFRDIEHVIQPSPRIVFIGDSFVWGYDVEQSERFTEILRSEARGWSVYNLGVSGFGTGQEYLLLQREYAFYRPQVVFLVFCTDNDDDDNSTNFRYGLYYKPYFTIERQGLKLNGVPVPTSEAFFFSRHRLLGKSGWVRLGAHAYFNLKAPPIYHAPKPPTDSILAAMHRFVRARGAQFVVGLQRPYPELEQFLDHEGIPRVDLSNPFVYPTGGHHWTPEGHAYVSRRIAEFLTQNKYLVAHD